MLLRCSCTRRSSTTSPPSPTTPATRTSSPPLALASSSPTILHRTSTRVGVPRPPLSHAPPRCCPGKPCLAEHHRQDATAEKAGKGPGCNLFFSFEGVFASFLGLSSEILKCITNHKKIVKMQTQLIWNPCNKIYKFCNSHICRNSTEFNLGKRIRKSTHACSGSSTQQTTLIFEYVVTGGIVSSQ